MTELPPLLPEYLEPVRALFEKPRVKQAMKLLDDGAEAAMVMQCELCEIPAPTFHEEVRAAEIVRRMKALGIKDVHVDDPRLAAARLKKRESRSPTRGCGFLSFFR